MGDHWEIRRNRKRYPLHKRNLGIYINITNILMQKKLLKKI